MFKIPMILLFTISLSFGLIGCQPTDGQVTVSQPKQVSEKFRALSFKQALSVLSGKTYSVPNEALSSDPKENRWARSITYSRDDTNRAYRYYPNWTKTGLDYYALGSFKKGKQKRPKVIDGVMYKNQDTVCITDELNRNSSSCEMIFQKGIRYYLNGDLDSEILFSDGYHNLLTPLVKRAVVDNNNKLLWALANDFKRLEPDLVSKFRTADMRVWAKSVAREEAILKQRQKERLAAERKEQVAYEQRRAAQEAKCKRETGSACKGTGGGLLGAAIRGTIRTVESAGNTSSSSTTVGTFQPTKKYTLICREQGLLSDHVPTISVSCTGPEASCKTKFEKDVSSKYGSFGGACGKLVKNNWYYSTIRVE